MTTWPSVTVFNMSEADAEDITKACENFLLALYGASTSQSLDDVRLTAFRKKSAKKSTNTVFQMASLPPTCAAAHQHSFRTYCQVQQWLENDIDPAKWGWILSNGSLCPIPTDLPSAPDKVLHVVSCSCKSGCNHGCSCRRAQMPCSYICNCMELACNNILHLDTCVEDWLERVAVRNCEWVVVEELD